VALLGANGSGKTTLLHIFVGVIWPTSGEVLVHGKPLTRRNVRDVRRRVSLLFQDPNDQVFAPTVEQDVAFGPTNLGLSSEEVSERVDWALSLVDLERYRERSPHTLSTGELKRVALAGVVAMRPEVLLLDEPFAGLDAPGRRDAMELVRTVQRELEVAILIATHDTDMLADVVDRAVVLSEGEVALDGPVEKVLNDPELEAFGVEQPPLARLSTRLRARGISIPPTLTLESTEKELLSLLKK